MAASNTADNTTATSRALHLPDIIHHILAHCVSPTNFHGREQGKALVSALLVCQDWNRPATDLLWKHDPPLRAIVSLPTERQQFFAAKIHDLILREKWTEDTIATHIGPDVRFTALQSLDVGVTGWGGASKPWLHKLLGHSLRDLKLDVCDFSREHGEDPWSLVQLQSPGLRTLSTDYSLVWQWADSFYSMLDSLRLEELSIGGNSQHEDAIPTWSETLLHISRHTSLRVIEIYTTIDAASVQEAALRGEKLRFPALQKVSLKVARDALFDAVDLFTEVGVSDLWLHLAEYPMDGIHDVDKSILSCVGKLTSLRVLSITQEGSIRNAVSLGISSFVELLSHLPILERLILDAPANEYDLNLWRNCQRLKVLCLVAAVDCRNVKEDAGLFPELEELIIDSLHPLAAASRDDDRLVEENPAIAAHLDGLLQAAPKLQEMVCRGDHDQTKAVMRYIAKVRNNPELAAQDDSDDERSWYM